MQKSGEGLKWAVLKVFEYTTGKCLKLSKRL